MPFRATLAGDTARTGPECPRTPTPQNLAPVPICQLERECS
jgi:hypothetical protein